MYNDIIAEHFMNPRNIGELERPDERISIGNPICGDTIHLDVAFKDGRIADMKYKAYGCATSIATASVFSEFAIGKTVSEIRETSSGEREAMLGELEPNQMHCLDILSELFRSLGLVKEV